MATTLLQLVLTTIVWSIVVEAQNNSTLSELRANTSLPDFTVLCPYTRFCQSSPIKDTGSADLESCCEKCSCNNDCFEIGNCCPDVSFAGPFQPKYECLKLSNLTEGITGKTVYNNNNLWYHVIANCPDVATEVVYPNCGMPSKIRDLIPVSDPVNGRVYRNSQCAECNGVKTYDMWNLRVDCHDIYSTTFQTFEEKDQFLFENCASLPQPPERNTGELSRCYPDSKIIKVCNVTGLMENYDKDVEMNCLKQELDQNTIYTKPDLFGYKLYANVYCFLCNEANAMAEVKDCVLRKDSVGEKNNFVTYTGLIDFSTEDHSIKDVKCMSMEIWDPIKNVCRTLVCPGGTFPYSGICRDINRLSTGYIIETFFEISTALVETFPVNTTFLKIVEDRVFRQIGSDCGKCTSSILGQKNATKFIFSVRVFSTEKCSTTTLLHTLHEIAVRNTITAKYRYQGKIHTIEMKLALNHTQSNGKLIRLVYKTCVPAMYKLDSSILLYCPRIDIAREEAFSLGLLKTSADYNQTNAADTDVIPVCFDAYLLASESLSGKACSYHHHDNCKTLLLVFTLTIVFVKSFFTNM